MSTVSWRDDLVGWIFGTHRRETRPQEHEKRGQNVPTRTAAGRTKGARTTEPLELADEADRTLVAERRRGAPVGGRTGESGELGRAVSAYGPWKLPPVRLK
jgi:hypothetical protein